MQTENANSLYDNRIISDQIFVVIAQFFMLDLPSIISIWWIQSNMKRLRIFNTVYL